MIKLSKTVKIAHTKFKTRKWRSFFSGCTISLGIIIILVIVIAAAGLTTFARSVFKDTLQDRYIAGDINMGFVNVSPGANQSNKTEYKKQTPEEYAKQYYDFNFKKIHDVSLARASFALADLPVKLNPEAGITDQFLNSFGMVQSDEIFIADVLNPSHSFKDEYDGDIPVVMPISVFQFAEYSGGAFAQDFEGKKRYEETARIMEKHIGKRYEIEQIIDMTQDQQESVLSGGLKDGDVKKIKTGVFVRIVGFTNYATLTGAFTPGITGNMAVPLWAVESNPKIKSLMQEANANYYVEFNTEKELKDFIKRGSGRFVEIRSRLSALESVLHELRKVGYVVGGILLSISALFIFTTLAKLVADSRREIGVFRAVGASRSDISKIFFAYAILLSTIGYLIGFIGAYLITIILSIVFGETIFYEMSEFATTLNIEKPQFLFVGFPLSILGIVYLFTVFVGLIAAFFPARSAAGVDPIKALREG